MRFRDIAIHDRQCNRCQHHKCYSIIFHRHFNIRSIPTLMMFREQVIIFSEAGALPEAPFRDLIGKAEALDMADVKRQIEEEQKKA